MIRLFGWCQSIDKNQQRCIQIRNHMRQVEIVVAMARERRGSEAIECKSLSHGFRLLVISNWPIFMIRLISLLIRLFFFLVFLFSVSFQCLEQEKHVLRRKLSEAESERDLRVQELESDYNDLKSKLISQVIKHKFRARVASHGYSTHYTSGRELDK